jgi:transcriptional antiterminator Rof (Rho-off)
VTDAPYTPIDCSFYDRIEAAAVRGRPVAIRLVDGREATARVLDVGSRDGAEWVEIEGVGSVRADVIESLGGVVRPGSAACRVTR